jgi:hypothetical protein
MRNWRPVSSELLATAVRLMGPVSVAYKIFESRVDRIAPHVWRVVY